MIARVSPGAKDAVVLCVDDDPSTLSALRRVLRPEPYEVVTTSTAEEALMRIETGPVQLVISDHRMPGMSGADLLERVRKMSPRTIRVMLTGFPESGLVSYGLAHGIDWLISKPWSDGALRGALRQLLEGREETAGRLPGASEGAGTEPRLLEEITRRLGYFPPLFEPAARVPSVLRTLWLEMKVSYLDNPLPGLFKEKLFAYLSRFCGPSYALIAHGCALRGLGMSGPEILELLEEPPPALEFDLVEPLAALWSTAGPLKSWPEAGSKLDRGLFRCAVAQVRGGSRTERARAELRRVLGEEGYARLHALLGFIGLCHAWSEAHPEIAPDRDGRVMAHRAALTAEEPRLSAFFETHAERVKSERNRVEDKLLDVIRVLRGREAALRQAQEELEARVRERTAELSRVNAELLDDIAARKRAEEERDRLTAQLLQGQKLQAIGQLSAGIAHEINNPVGYILSNLTALKEYLADLTRLLRASLGADPGLERLRGEIDADFMLEDFGKALEETRQGAERIRDIVRGLREFSHVDEGERVAVDLRDLVEDGLRICWNELKYKAEVKRDYGKVGPVHCYPRRVGQVFVNLLVNAAQAIEERGEIHVSTRVVGDRAEVLVRDTGRGISKEALPRIFEPFFTTKPVGEGTGLGLHVAYKIVRAHGGEIEVTSEVGKGTAVAVRLPLSEPPRGSADGPREGGSAP
jgi:signal transduction histidine kinase/CheY-like chemotaxis protein